MRQLGGKCERNARPAPRCLRSRCAPTREHPTGTCHAFLAEEVRLPLLLCHHSHIRPGLMTGAVGCSRLKRLRRFHFKVRTHILCAPASQDRRFMLFRSPWCSAREAVLESQRYARNPPEPADSGALPEQRLNQQPGRATKEPDNNNRPGLMRFITI